MAGEFLQAAVFDARNTLFPQVEQSTPPDSFHEQIETLRGVKGMGEFLTRVDAMAIDVFNTSDKPALTTIRQEICTGIESNKIQNAIVNQEFGNTPSDTATYDRLLAAVHVKNQIGRAIVQKILEGENRLELTETEKVITLTQCELAGHFDVFYRKFHRDMVTLQPEKAFHDIVKGDPQNGAKMARSLLKGKGIEFPPKGFVYHMIEGSEEADQYTFVPYSKKYAEEVQEIAALLDTATSRLDEIVGEETSDTKSLSDYFKELRKALSNTSESVDDHERNWQDVDIKWAAIKGKMQPIHMMESYLDPFGERVEPEMVLAFRDERQEWLNQAIDTTKQNVAEMLNQRLLGKASHAKSLSLLDSTLVGFYSSILSGRRIDFRAAGQNVPNREDLRIQYGVKVFLDLDTLRMRWESEKKLLTKIFGERTADLFSDEESLILSEAVVRVPGHEYGHNTAIQEETREKLGTDNYKNLEETKANLTALTTIHSSENWLDGTQKRNVLKAMFAVCIRSLSLKSDESKRPYYNSSIAQLNDMISAGMITFEKPDQWIYDDSEEKVQKYLSICATKFDELVDVYDRLDKPAAESWMNVNYVETDHIKQLEKTIK